MALKPLARGGVGYVAQIRRLLPLPETSNELCTVAASLGAQSTEGEYRIIHFATHGALSGEIDGNAEPGLVLTPPRIASEFDDGYLTASEIATLKLDSDWVILSACNTAAAGSANAESLSGLARAFFSAGARSLLVSHWAVELGRDSGAHHQDICHSADRPAYRPRRGSAPFYGGSDLEGRCLRASRDLGTVRPGG